MTILPSWPAALLVCALVLPAAPSASAQTSPAQGKSLLSRIPFSFERNTGRLADASAGWVAHQNGYAIQLSAAGATIVPATPGSLSIRMQFADARAAAKSEALEPLPGKVNYLIGADPKRWVRDVETFRRVLYHNVYDGVDVVWYGSEGQIEYDFVVRPGADTSRIALRFEGARKLALEPGGDLRVETAGGPLTLRVPVVYQDAGAVRTRVEGHYVLRAGNEVSFALAGYDKSRPLVIDPTLVYAAWFSSRNPTVTAMATDPQGNIYVGGQASWLPTVSAVEPGALGSLDPFVIKFDPTGTTTLYATFVGGTAFPGAEVGDVLNALVVDSTGHAVATGRAISSDFPAVNAAAPTCTNADSPCGFLFRLNPAGNGLIYSTYTPTTNYTPTGDSVAADSTGNAYVAEVSAVEKYAPTGAVLYHSSLVGGNAITVDQQGSAYVAGEVTLPAFQGVPGARDVTGSQCTNKISCTFVAKLSADGKALSWAAVLGASGSQTPNAIARDATSGVVYIAGETTATDLPVTAGVIQATAHGQSDGFLASVSADGSAFGFVTYLGGFADDKIYALALTPDGQIVVAGDTFSADFPVSGAIQPMFGGNSSSFYVTSNSGSTWTPAGTGLPSFGSGSYTPMLASVDPGNPEIIVAATSGGLFRTTNGGAPWTPVGSPANYTGLSRSLSNPQVLYAQNFTLLSESTDGGATWSPFTYVFPGLYTNISTMAVSPADAQTVVLIGQDTGIYLYTAGNGMPMRAQRYGAMMGVPPTSSPDGSIYVPETGSSGFLKSTDNGQTWKELAGSPHLWLNDNQPLSVCTANPSVLYLADLTTSLYRSTDAGATWSMLNISGMPNEVAVAPSNCQVVYASVWGYPALQISTDGGDTWSPASGNLTASPYTGIFVDPTNPAHAWVAASVNADGFVAKISNDGKTLLWSTFYGGSNKEDVHGVIADSAGNVWFAGTTASSDVPGFSGVQPGFNQTSIFLAEISDATAACSWRLAPQSAIPPATGGVVNFAVTAPSGCAWTATPSDTWISTPQSPGGTGSGSVAAVVSANSTVTRTGTVSVGGQTFTITQPASSCQYSLDQTSFLLPSSGGQVTVNVTAGSGCPWSVVPSGVAVVSGASGVGNGVAILSAPANPGMSAVSYTADIGQQTVTVKVAENCTYSLSPLSMDGTATSISATLTASAAACQWTASTNASWLLVPSSGTGSAGIALGTLNKNHTGAPRSAIITIGAQTFTFTQSVDPLPQYTLTVLVQPPGSGTAQPDGVYDAGTNVCVWETPNTGWTFSWWSGPQGVSLPCLTLNANTTVTANFVSSSALFFVPVTPCRVVDTRYPNGDFGSPSLPAGGTRSFAVPNSSCNIPSSAAAYSLNLTVVPQGQLWYVTVWPTGAAQPNVSTLNSLDGRIKANAAIIPAGTNGAVSVYATGITDVILDIDGYFVPASSPNALAFYPLPPCRIADTRYSSFGALGSPSLGVGQTRSFDVLSSGCNVPSSAQAYSLNFTVVPIGSLLFITTFPTGQAQPNASTLNDPTGTIVANAAIVPAGTGGAVSVYNYNATTDLIVDIDGYFAPPGAGGLALYNLSPCRVLDTRQGGSAPLSGEKDVDVVGSGCGAPAAAQAYVFNATVAPPGLLWYLTLWPQGASQPWVSTLNAIDGAITSNMAIVPSSNGSVSAAPSNPSHLILDIFGYFAP